MSIGAEDGGVAKVNKTFVDFADTHALPKTVRRSLIVVLDELLSNTIKYGLSGVEGGWITVEAELQPDRLLLTLIDNGKPFNPLGSAVPDVTLSVEERPIGSLGIHLVRQLMDEVNYQRRDDNNVVVLAKLLAGGV